MIGHPVLYEDDDNEDVEVNLFQRLERILWSLAVLYNLSRKHCSILCKICKSVDKILAIPDHYSSFSSV